jgi:hypothetical protein
MAEKIVDAVASVPAAQKTSMSVPLKIDGGSAMAQMLQQMAATQAQPASQAVNPAEHIRTSAARMEEIYARYTNLLRLGKQLNGKNKTDPLPDTLQIDNVGITFRVKEGETLSEPVTADIKNIICVADLSTIISAEMGLMILELQQLNAGVLDIGRRAEEQYAKSRKQWEESNKDRQIVTAETATATENEKSPV